MRKMGAKGLGRGVVRNMIPPKPLGVKPLAPSRQKQSKDAQSITASAQGAGGVEEVFQLHPPAMGTAPQIAMTIRLNNKLTELLANCKENAVPMIKFGATPDGHIIKIGTTEFKFSSMPEKTLGLCDCYGEAHTEGGECVLTHVGSVIRKLSVQHELNNQEFAKWKQKSEQAGKQKKNRTMKVVDVKTPAPAPLPTRGKQRQPAAPKPVNLPLRSQTPPPSALAKCHMEQIQVGPPPAVTATAARELKAESPVETAGPSKGTKHPLLPLNSSSTDLRAYLIKILSEAKGLKLQTIEKQTQMKKGQLEVVLRQVAKYHAPGLWKLLPSVEAESVVKSSSANGSPNDGMMSSPSSNRHASETSPKAEEAARGRLQDSLNTAAAAKLSPPEQLTAEVSKGTESAWEHLPSVDQSHLPNTAVNRGELAPRSGSNHQQLSSRAATKGKVLVDKGSVVQTSPSLISRSASRKQGKRAEPMGGAPPSEGQSKVGAEAPAGTAEAGSEESGSSSGSASESGSDSESSGSGSGSGSASDSDSEVDADGDGGGNSSSGEDEEEHGDEDVEIDIDSDGGEGLPSSHSKSQRQEARILREGKAPRPELRAASEQGGAHQDLERPCSQTKGSEVAKGALAARPTPVEEARVAAIRVGGEKEDGKMLTAKAPEDDSNLASGARPGTGVPSPHIAEAQQAAAAAGGDEQAAVAADRVQANAVAEMAGHTSSGNSKDVESRETLEAQLRDLVKGDGDRQPSAERKQQFKAPELRSTAPKIRVLPPGATRRQATATAGTGDKDEKVAAGRPSPKVPAGPPKKPREGSILEMPPDQGAAQASVSLLKRPRESSAPGALVEQPTPEAFPPPKRARLAEEVHPPAAVSNRPATGEKLPPSTPGVKGSLAGAGKQAKAVRLPVPGLHPSPKHPKLRRDGGNSKKSPCPPAKPSPHVKSKTPAISGAPVQPSKAAPSMRKSPNPQAGVVSPNAPSSSPPSLSPPRERGASAGRMGSSEEEAGAQADPEKDERSTAPVKRKRDNDVALTSGKPRASAEAHPDLFFSKFERAAPLPCKPCTSHAQYKEYLDEFLEKFEIYDRLDASLEKDRVEYEQLYHAMQAAPAEKERELADHMRSKFRSVKERTLRMRAAFLVLHQELAMLKQQMVKYAKEHDSGKSAAA